MATPTQINQIVAGIDPAAAEAAYRKAEALNSAYVEKVLQSRANLSRDLSRYDADDSAQAIRFNQESVEAQVAGFEKLRRERQAFGFEFQQLQQQMRQAQLLNPQLLPEDVFSGDHLEKYKAGLQAQQVLFKEHQEAQVQIVKDRDERISKVAGLIGGVAGAAGSALARTSQGTPGEQSVSTMGSALSSIASSKNTWELLLNTTRGILDVASNMYSTYLRRTQQQLDVASGSNQFLRFANDPSNSARTRETLRQLEYSTKLTPVEAKEAVGALGAVRRQLPSFDTGDTQGAFGSMNKLATTAVYLGRNMTELGSTVADLARRSGQDFNTVLDQVARAGAHIDSLGEGTRLSKEKFVNDSLQLAQQLQSLRFKFSDAEAIVGKWAVALQDGTLSIGQLVQMLQGHRSADAGTTAFLSPQVLEYVRQNARSQLGDAAGSQVIAAIEKQGTAVGRGTLTNVLRGGNESSLAYREAGLNFNEDQLKKSGQLFERAYDAAIRRASELVGGPDLGTRILTRGQLYDSIGGSAGRNLRGAAYDVRETARRQGIGAGDELRIKENLGQTSQLVSAEKTQQILDTTSKQISQMREDTNGILRQITNAIVPGIERGTERLVDTFKKEGATAAAKLFLEGLKNAFEPEGTKPLTPQQESNLYNLRKGNTTGGTTNTDLKPGSRR